MATRSFTVLQTDSHIPHPTHASEDNTNRSDSKSMSSAFVGHLETQAWHPCPAVHRRCVMVAIPMRTAAMPSTGTNASVAQAAIQGRSSHKAHGVSSAKIPGVPSLVTMMAPGGQVSIQSPHFVQHSKNNASLTAPGGRSQSVRTGGVTGTAVDSFCCANSCAALATDSTESFRKSRRPYEGLVAISATSHHRLEACRLPRTDRIRRIPRPTPGGFPG